ncbi:MAG: 2-oxoglutarate and iron-dependent oxygenase domain-containing protein [Pseudomonadota bacterium]
MSYATAKHVGVEEIPVIDMTPLHDDSEAGLKLVGAQMREAVERIGFFYVRNHGVDLSLIEQVDALAHRFFAQPLENKLQVEPVDRHRGYLKVGEAKMYSRAQPDLKESFIWGIDVAEDDADYLAGNPMIGPNRWPAFMPELQPALNAYMDASHLCAQRMLRALAVSLDVSDDTFVRHFNKPISRGALVHYPPQPPDAGDQQFGVAPHTDYGVITLLHQDNVGGLQVFSNQREWVTAHPIPGTLVINSGDLLGRWSNDRFRSNSHRVVNSSGRERLSIAMFVDPDFDTPIIPVTQGEEMANYPPVTCGDYIAGRFDKSFAYRLRAG